MPSEVWVNAPFKYSITVTNVTDMSIPDVVVTEDILGNVLKVKNSTPAAAKEGGKLVWRLGSFRPEESKQIKIEGTANNTGCIETCTTATTTYIVPACANAKVVLPSLQLKKTAPAEVLLCDPIPVKFVVTNTGTGSTRNVKIEDTIPEGLKTADGRSKLVFDAGTLAGGQSRQFSVTLKASKTGEYVSRAVATSAAGLKAQSETTTAVRQPVLAISKTGPAWRYLGRPIAYEITVTNKGDGPAKNLVVEDQLPAGVKFVSASDKGSLSRKKVLWKLGTLPPKRSRKVTVRLLPQDKGDMIITAKATATCAEGVNASVRTRVAGIPAVLLEVIDVDDPIELGGQMTYVITTTNQGSLPGTNIKIVCTLEENQQYVSSRGPTEGTIKGNTLTFETLRKLAPKAKATWRVVIKAIKAGDVRFKVTMNTDQITRPVEETEATHLYE
ncbi:MAG: COG1361 family protein [Planctomycetota bacterium]